MNDQKINTAKYMELAKKTWDERQAHIIGTIRFQKAIIVVAAVLCVLLLYALITKKNYVYTPYIVEINNNEVRFAGFVQNRNLKASDAETIFYIKRFVNNLFSVSSDTVLVKNNLVDVYNFTGPQAQYQVTEYISENNPINKSANGIRVDIRFNLFEKVTEHTWRCEWLEETRNKGLLQSQIIKTGTFTYSQDYPQTQLQAETNPSGIFFTEYYVTERR